MKIIAGLLILAVSLQPYIVCANSDAAAAAAAAASAASAGDGDATAAAVATATATATTTCSARIPCKCERIYKPVCGCDGRTYSNECVLNSISDHRVENNFPPLHVKSLGECLYKQCRCPPGGETLCGIDGQTYANECYFDCENTRRNIVGLSPIKVANHGVCPLPTCICSACVIPVCGTDGRTYKNICILECVSRHNQANRKPAIRVKSEGICDKENCSCPLYIDPLCANDGNTYNHQCHLHCENRKRYQLGKHPLIVQYKGKCVDCRCPKIYAPVCASNGVTSANPCTLGCENKRRLEEGLPLLTFYHGVCPCYCTLEYRPVCGTDDRTYPNECQLRCENNRRSDLGLPLIAIAYRGRCRCYCRCCSRKYEPVCGSDGRSYWNMCWLICNRGCRNDIGRRLFMLYKGPC